MIAKPHPLLSNDQTRKDWLKRRQLGIGASDVACLYGLGFLDASELYQDKVAEEPIERPLSERMRSGLENEPCIAARYTEKTGFELVPSHGVIQSRKWPIAFCTLDRSRGRPVELKAVFGPPGGADDWRIEGDAWGADGSDRCPRRVIMQAVWQSGCAESDWTDVAALFMGYEFRVYYIPFIPPLFEAMVEDGVEFWRFVQERTPPPPGWKPKRLEVATSLAARTMPGSQTVLGPESQQFVTDYVDAVEKKRLYEQIRKLSVENLEKMLGQYEVGYSPDGSKVVRIDVEGRNVSYYQQPYTYARVYPRKKGK